MTVDEIMEKVCGCCHYPYVESDQDAMDERCAGCEIEKAIRQALTEQAEKFGRVIAESLREALENPPKWGDGNTQTRIDKHAE